MVDWGVMIGRRSSLPILGHRPFDPFRTGAGLALILLGGFAVAGPAGLLAWKEYTSLRDQRLAQVVQLTAERDALRNRVSLLDPDAVDPDMAGELVRGQLEVVAPGEVVVRFDD